MEESETARMRPQKGELINSAIELDNQTDEKFSRGRQRDREESVPFPENARLRVSQIESFLSDFVHERRSFPVSSGRVRLGVEENAGLVE